MLLRPRLSKQHMAKVEKQVPCKALVQCGFYRRGFCKFGESCKFSHIEDAAKAVSMPTTLPKTSTRCRSYEGHIVHASFGPTPLSINVQLQTSTTGQWVVMGERIDITVAHEDGQVVFSDGQTILNGTFDELGAFHGEVVQEGVGGGSTTLIPHPKKNEVEDGEKRNKEKKPVVTRSEDTIPGQESTTLNKHVFECYGVVKPKTDAGYGWIACMEIRKQYQRDAYMSWGCCANFREDDRVVFHYNVSLGKAFNVRLAD